MENKSFKIKNNIFVNQEGLQFLRTIEKNSVDLILTDPPYITSRKTGMDTYYTKVQQADEGDNTISKTEKEWKEYSAKKDWPSFYREYKIEEEHRPKKMIELKKSFMKYGTIFGRKFAVKTDYGSWDKDFSMDILAAFIKEYSRVLRDGGTGIIFFDLWKIGELKKLLEDNRFKQIRMIEWIKTNPQPINSKVNYLTNCREVAVTFVKKSKPTFNSSYDNGIYRYPIAAGKDRFHPTQKNKDMFIRLIKKHSKPGDVVLDTFAGSGTTLVAAKEAGRCFIGCEKDNGYFIKAQERLDKEQCSLEEYFLKEQERLDKEKISLTGYVFKQQERLDKEKNERKN